MRVTAPKVIKVILVITITGVTYSCASFGERLVIDTDAPVEDFLVKCKKSHNYLIAHNASSYTASGKEFIARSNEEVSCGLIVSGYNSRSQVSHPTYIQVRWDNMKVGHTDNGATIKKFVHWKEKNKQAIKLYEEGYWDKKYNYVYSEGSKFTPVDELLKHISSCYISKEYLEIYNNSSTLNYQKIKDNYYSDILKCNRENERIRHKYGKSTDYFYYGRQGPYEEALMQCLYHPQNCRKNKEYLPERATKARNNHMWSSAVWDPYLNDFDKERNRLTKKTFLVGYGLQFNTKDWYLKDWSKLDEKTKHAWLRIDAFTKKDIKEKRWGLTVFDTEPTWLLTYKKENFIKNCDGNELHIDIDDMPEELIKAMYNTVKGLKVSYCHNQ